VFLYFYIVVLFVVVFDDRYFIDVGWY